MNIDRAMIFECNIVARDMKMKMIYNCSTLLYQYSDAGGLQQSNDLFENNFGARSMGTILLERDPSARIDSFAR
jgi:hypothetical protein